ncbi:M6 family metalloprotease domain-containing protein [Halioxenophilus aromaticivorans]|uniref:Peptidase M6-like domain-containing protein n=1 Tax=Halioxenophilus aromaticivorans TaxID=1306992 RepID=A0AAV3U0D6_9ALTE
MCHEQCLCVVPPSPKLEEDIYRAKKFKDLNKVLDNSFSFDVLDLRSAEAIFSRPARTRAHTLIAANVDRAPITGTRRALVVMVDFNDQVATQAPQHYSDMLFSAGTYATGSMRDFYREASYNQLDVVGSVHGWYRAPQTKDYYTNDDYGFGAYPRNAQKLAEDVIDLAAPHVDFSDYDNDGDGIVEALVIIVAGSGGEVTGDTGDIWSHKWGINPKNYNGVSIQTYFMAPEDGKVGVMSHELGHLLMKWPDLYDTDYSSRGTGRWDLMAGGSWNNGGDTPAHPTAWCKLKAGWITPKVVYDTQQSVEIKPYHSSGDVYKLPVGSEDSKEYFLVSNRQQSRFDTYLPGGGCIIEHVDDNQSNNSDESHYLVDIEQADGLAQLNSNANSGDAGDAFPNGGNTVFDKNSTPSSNAYSGAGSDVSVSEIAIDGDLVQAIIKVGNVTNTTKTWHNFIEVTSVYTTYHSQNCWAEFAGFGWRKVETGNAAGVTSSLAVLCEAKANGSRVNAYLDDEKIYGLYLV